VTTGNPHSVTATQVGLSNVDNTSDLNKPISTATQTALNDKLDKTNVYYSNLAGGTAIYVRFAAIKIKSTYQKVNIKANVGIGGNARDYGEIEIQINGSDPYNTFLSSTHYLASSKVTHFPTDTFTYVTVDNGVNDYDIFLWVKVEAYAKIHFTITDYYVENSTNTVVDFLPTSPTTSSSAPTGTAFYHLGKKLEDNYFIATGGESSFTIALPFNTTYDEYYTYVNGFKLIYGRHYSISGTILSLLGGYTLTAGDEVEEVVHHGVK
jgi:hypothetical protein